MSEITDEIYAKAEAICEAGYRLWQRGLIAATDGNFSARISNGWLLITSSGLSKGFLTTSDLILLDESGTIRAGEGEPSIETGLHRAIYAARPDVETIIHAHPALATASTLAGVDLNLNAPDEVRLQLGHIAVAAHAEAGSAALAAKAAAALGEDNVLLLERHGAVTVGADIYQALYRLEALEQAARMSLAARLWRQSE